MVNIIKELMLLTNDIHNPFPIINCKCHLLSPLLMYAVWSGFILFASIMSDESVSGWILATTVSLDYATELMISGSEFKVNYCYWTKNPSDIISLLGCNSEG